MVFAILIFSEAWKEVWRGAEGAWRGVEGCGVAQRGTKDTERQRGHRGVWRGGHGLAWRDAEGCIICGLRTLKVHHCLSIVTIG